MKALFHQVNIETRFLLKNAIAIVFFLYILLVMSYKIGSFPGLHGDEAWFGLSAKKIIDEGVKSIHGMNTYTSSLYSWIISLMFRLEGINIASLRWPGIIFNWLGFVLVFISLDKYVGRKSSLFFLVILLGCSPLLLFPRTAWEVCALQGLLLSIKFSILLKAFYKQKNSTLEIFVFFLVTCIGVVNHFIFIYESLALAAALLTILLLFPDKNKISLFYLASLSLVLVTLVYLQKPKINDGQFQEFGLELFLTTLGLIGLLTLIYQTFKLSIAQATLNGLQNQKILRYISLFIISVGTTFILIKLFPYHFWSIFGTFSGIILVQRNSSYQYTQSEYGAIHIIWFLIIAVFIIAGIQKIISSYKTYQTETLFFYFYPLWCLFFLAFLGQNSERYYYIPCYLFAFVYPLVVSLNNYTRSLKLGIIGLWICNLALQQTVLWKNITYTDNRQPRFIQYHTYQDLSHHSLKIDELYNTLKLEKICHLDEETNYFIKKPLEFYFLMKPFPCNPLPVVYIEYCEQCQQSPKYYKITPNQS